MSDPTKQLASLLNEIRVSDSVAVIGAGFSFQAGMPLAGQLAPLVWQTLDVHPHVKTATANHLNVCDQSAKAIVGHEEWDRLQVAFSQIAANWDAQSYFQQSFVRLNQERSVSPSPVHRALAQLIHEGRVSHIVSLNWDTLLEEAFRNLYGIDVNSQGLKMWKPHGDCLRPDEPWVLPHASGSIPAELVDRMAGLARERPRTLLIVGYSERDDIVVNRLIRPLTSKWRVFRISPNASGEGAIQLSAQEALQALAFGLCPHSESDAWQHVTFANQRGIEGAISGERLGAQDVDCCPRLPHFETALRALDLLHTVEIAGGPGCGKSITAWQLARTYNHQGWEVLRLRSIGARSTDDLILAATRTSWKKMLVLDDAQTLPEGLPDRVTSLASPLIKVIRATTDSAGERPRAVRIASKVAVEVLSEDFRRRRGELLSIVRRYDPSIGDGYADTPLERRIDDAAVSDTPWQFAFVLRGGWNQFGQELQILRDFDRCDLLFVLIAIRQILSLDAGCMEADLREDMGRMKRTERWTIDGIEHLRRRNAILSGDPIRCPHIRSAAKVIDRFFSNRKDPEFATVVSFLRSSPLLESASLRGISWLLWEVSSTGSYFGPKDTFWAFWWPEHVGLLLQRCERAATPQERRDATFLLGKLLGDHVITSKDLLLRMNTLKRWLEAAETTNAGALGSLINNLYNEDKDAAKLLVQEVTPETIAGQLAKVPTADAYVWGYVFGRLHIAAADGWRDRVKSLLPRREIRMLMTAFRGTELGELTELLTNISACDFDFATECLTIAMPALQDGFSSDAVTALQATEHLRWYLLGFPIFDPPKPNRAQLKLSKTIAGAIRPERVAFGIETSRHGDWAKYAELLDWVRRVNRPCHRAIVNKLDWQKLDHRTAEMWARPPRELGQLLYSLAIDSKGQPVRTWVAERADRIQEIGPLLAAVCPEAAVSVIRNGGRFESKEYQWDLQAHALARVGEIDRDAVTNIVVEDLPRIAARLARLEEIDCEDLLLFLETIHQVVPECVSRILNEVDLAVASDMWPKHPKDSRHEVRRGRRAILRFVRQHGSDAMKLLAGRSLTGRKT